MSRTGINDKIMDKMMTYQEKTIKKIGEILKGEQPFASVEVKPDDLIKSVRGLQPMELNQLAQEFGADKLEKLLYDVHVMETRRQK